MLEDQSPGCHKILLSYFAGKKHVSQVKIRVWVLT